MKARISALMASISTEDKSARRARAANGLLLITSW
jgi:hypothetical protein